MTNKAVFHVLLPKTTFPLRPSPRTPPPRLLVPPISPSSPSFVLLDGPPFANGDLHAGHLLNKTLKDGLIRFHAQRGFAVEVKLGWDCHGLPIEARVLEGSRMNTMMAQSTGGIAQSASGSGMNTMMAQSANGVAQSASGIAQSGSGTAQSGSGTAQSGSGIAQSGSGTAQSASGIALLASGIAQSFEISPGKVMLTVEAKEAFPNNSRVIEGSGTDMGIAQSASSGIARLPEKSAGSSENSAAKDGKEVAESKGGMKTTRMAETSGGSERLSEKSVELENIMDGQARIQEQLSLEGKANSNGQSSLKKQSKNASPSFLNNSTTPAELRTKCKTFAQIAMEKQALDFQKWGILGSNSMAYKTMSGKYEAKELNVFKDLVARNLVRRGFKPVFWSPDSRTALAEAELEYKDDHESSSVYVKFDGAILQLPQLGETKVSLVAWTTTPWSLSGNEALAVNRLASYVLVDTDDWKSPRVVIAEALLSEFKEHCVKSNIQVKNVLASFPGSTLIGVSAISPLLNKRVEVIHAPHVTTNSGTGIVHIAPFHGQEDWACWNASCSDKFLDEQIKIDFSGRFIPSDVLPESLHGKRALHEGNSAVLDFLNQHDKLLGQPKKYLHKYPYDWRTKSPVMIMATRQFFIHLDDGVTKRAAEALKEVKFVPASARKRLLSTLDTRTEWCISRQRSWGLPIPYYYKDDDPDAVLMTDQVIGTFSDLCAANDEVGSNIWFQPIENESEDPILPANERGKGWKRGRDTLDVWFDSGTAWFASMDGDAKSTICSRPADVVLEGSDQHRGWFQSLLLTAIGVGNKTAPFKAIVSHGFVLDERGQKMSKSLGNVVKPQDAIAKFNGVDVLRLWAATSDATNGDVQFGDESLKSAQDGLRKIRNVLRFLLSVIEPNQDWAEKAKQAEYYPMDLIVLNELGRMCETSIVGYESYDISQGIRPVLSFLTGDVMTVYMESIKDRMYCDEKDSKRRFACEVVCRLLLNRLVALIAPVCVFTCDEFLEHAFKVEGALEAMRGVDSMNNANTLMLKIENPPKEWFISDLDTLNAITEIFKLRERKNKLEALGNMKGSLNCEFAFENVLGSNPVLKEWCEVSGEGKQWSHLADALQVGRISLSPAKDDLAVVFPPEKKCERCRRFHDSVDERELIISKPTVKLCTRCHNAEQNAACKKKLTI